jgi:hypothetical protein
MQSSWPSTFISLRTLSGCNCKPSHPQSSLHSTQYSWDTISPSLFSIQLFWHPTFLMRHDFTIFVQHHNWLLIKPVCSMTYKQNCKRNKECNKWIIKFATSSSTPRAVITTLANSSVAYFTCSLLCSSHHPPCPPPSAPPSPEFFPAS